MTSQPDKHLYTAVDLDPILDALAGITGVATLAREDLREDFWEDPREELDEFPEVPLPEGFVGRVIDEAGRDDGGGAPRGRPWYLYLAAVFPVFALISFVLVLPWIPTDPNKLTYEEAHSVAFDPAYSEESRNVATGRINTAILHGVLILRHGMRKNPAIRKDGEAALQAIQDLLKYPSLAATGRLYQNGSFQQTLDRMRTRPSTTELRRLIARYVAGARSGFAILHHAESMPGLVGRQAKLKMAVIRRNLTRPIEQLKTLPPLKK